MRLAVYPAGRLTSEGYYSSSPLGFFGPGIGSGSRLGGGGGGKCGGGGGGFRSGGSGSGPGTGFRSDSSDFSLGSRMVMRPSSGTQSSTTSNPLPSLCSKTTPIRV